MYCKIYLFNKIMTVYDKHFLFEMQNFSYIKYIPAKTLYARYFTGLDLKRKWLNNSKSNNKKKMLFIFYRGKKNRTYQLL